MLYGKSIAQESITYPEPIDLNGVYNEIDRTMEAQNAFYLSDFWSAAKEKEKTAPNVSAASYYKIMTGIEDMALSPEKKALWKEAVSVKVYTQLGAVFDVEKPVRFDPVQKKNVLTFDLKKALIGFQKNKMLPQSGMVDFVTISAMTK